MSTLNVTNLKNEASASNNLTLDSNGRVGVGTESPDAILDVTRSGNGQIAVIQTAATRGFSFESQSDTQIQVASIQANTNFDLWANTITFSAGGSERGRFLSTGGLTFNGDTAAANALDDYEEGTFTFTLYDFNTGGNASPTTVTGHYTKIGDLVFVSVPNYNNISTSGMTGVNDLYFSLPFTASSSQNGAIGSPLFVGQMTFQSGVNYYAPRVDASNNRGLITGVRDGNTAINMAVNTLTSGSTDFGRLTLVYKTV